MLKGACAPILVWSCPPFWKIGFIPDLNWSAFLSSSLYGSFQFKILCSPELVSFPFKFPVWKLPICSPELVWKLPIWNPSSPVLNWSAFLSSFLYGSSSLYGSFQFGILPLELVSFPFKFPVWKLPIWNPSSPELVSFPFKFPVWKLPIWNPSSPVLNWSGWNPSSPVLNWSAFLSSSLCGSWSAFLSNSFCWSFQSWAGQLSFQIPFAEAFNLQPFLSYPGLSSFPFKFILCSL